MRRGQAGANPHQPESADESRGRREGRASRRVRVEGDQATSSGVQRVERLNGSKLFHCDEQ